MLNQLRVAGLPCFDDDHKAHRYIDTLPDIAKQVENGGTVKAFDPVAMQEMRHFYPNEKRMQLMGTAQDCCEDADALLINTEWREFRSPNWEALKASLKRPLIIDGRNLYDPKQVIEQGLVYDCIGRPQQDRRKSGVKAA